MPRPRVELTATEIDKALDRLSIFEGRLGYPKNSAGLKAAAIGFANIVHFKPVWEIEERFDDRLKGVTDDSVWLAQEIYEMTEKFPSMQKFRELYRQYLTPRWSREDIDIDVR